MNMDVSKLWAESGSIHQWLKDEKQKQSMALTKIMKSVSDQAEKNKKSKKKRPANDVVVFTSRDGIHRLKGAVGRLKSKMGDVLSSDLDNDTKMSRVSELQRKISSIEILISDIKRKERELEENVKPVKKKFDAYKYVMVRRGDIRNADESDGFMAVIGMAESTTSNTDMGMSMNAQAFEERGDSSSSIDVEV